MSEAIPTNHRLAERKLVALVRSGEWEIDDCGRIWRIAIRTGDRWRGGMRLVSCERRRAEKAIPTGYLMVRASIGGRRVVGLAHRLVWQAMHGDIRDGAVINHLNGLKHDNRPANLEPVSYSENTLHAYRTGLMDEHGERNPAARLSDHDTALIRKAYASGAFTMADLAKRYGCSHQNISKIVRGERRSMQEGPTSKSNPRVREFPTARAT